MGFVIAFAFSVEVFNRIHPSPATYNIAKIQACLCRVARVSACIRSREPVALLASLRVAKESLNGRILGLRFELLDKRKSKIFRTTLVKCLCSSTSHRSEHRNVECSNLYVRPSLGSSDSRWSDEVNVRVGR